MKTLQDMIDACTVPARPPYNAAWFAVPDHVMEPLCASLLMLECYVPEATREHRNKKMALYAPNGELIIGYDGAGSMPFINKKEYDILINQLETTHE